jgi:hypothetical protein
VRSGTDAFPRHSCAARTRHMGGQLHQAGHERGEESKEIMHFDEQAVSWWCPFLPQTLLFWVAASLCRLRECF